MTTRLVIDVDMKVIRKFAVLADIELTNEDETKLTEGETVLTPAKISELTDDCGRAELLLAGWVLARFFEKD